MNKKTTIITIISMVLSLLLITIGLSFAYFTANITNTEESTTINVTGGKMDIHYSGGDAMNTPDIEPSNDPFIVKNFTLKGNNTTDLNMSYHILFIIEENTFTDNSLKYKLTSTNTDNNGEVAPSIEELKGIPTGNDNEIFLGNANFDSPTNGDKFHTYNLELYFPDTQEDQNEDQGKIFKAYINIKADKYEYNQIQGVNHPVLFTGMTPVKWDSEFNEIETTENDPDWYDYDQKRWANAKSQDGSYWVWIPRYAYRITSGYRSSTTGTIDVKFLKETTNETVEGNTVEIEGYDSVNKTTSDYHFLHPAFHDELGFWVAKYEPTAHEGIDSETESCSGSDDTTLKTPLIAPNETSWRCITISNAYKTTLAMKGNPIYGWNSSEVDTHMMTNLEWGAVAYLSKSEYGAHTNEVWNNSYIDFQTGCSGTSVSAANEDTCVTYETEDGQKASTTYNIYGVYDMSGGSFENVMGTYNNERGSSGFSVEEFSSINSRHINHYYTAPEDLFDDVGVDYDLNFYGDAMHETSNNPYRYNGSSYIGNYFGAWGSDYSYLPYVTGHPWIHRGGYRSYYTPAGIFAFSRSNGASGHWHTSFRPAISSL